MYKWRMGGCFKKISAFLPFQIDLKLGYHGNWGIEFKQNHPGMTPRFPSFLGAETSKLQTVCTSAGLIFIRFTMALRPVLQMQRFAETARPFGVQSEDFLFSSGIPWGTAEVKFSQSRKCYWKCSFESVKSRRKTNPKRNRYGHHLCQKKTGHPVQTNLFACFKQPYLHEETSRPGEMSPEPTCNQHLGLDTTGATPKMYYNYYNR